jgi:recombination protein RecT
MANIQTSSGIRAVKQQPTSGNALKSYLANPAVKKKFEEILGNKAPGFISSIISAVSMNPSLAECPPDSIVAAAAIAASLDLPINPSLGMAHIVPYRNKDQGNAKVAQFQMGWKGFIQLGMRSGMYQLMNASIVHEGDINCINKFTGEIRFNDTDNEHRPIIGYCFYFKLVTGFEKFYYMTKKQCEKHGKKYSKSYSKGNWANDFDGMAIKTVVKQALSKYGVLSIEMQKAIATDQAVVNDQGEVVDYPDNPQNDISHAIEIEQKVEQTQKQQYNTLKLQLKNAGKATTMNEIIKGCMELGGHDEKDFNEKDLKLCIDQMTIELNEPQ